MSHWQRQLLVGNLNDYSFTSLKRGQPDLNRSSESSYSEQTPPWSNHSNVSVTQLLRTSANSIPATLWSRTFIVGIREPSVLSQSANSVAPVDINVTGSSSGSEGSVVVDLECSTNCTDITASGTDLTTPDGTPTYICKNITSLSSVSFRSKLSNPV